MLVWKVVSGGQSRVSTGQVWTLNLDTGSQLVSPADCLKFPMAKRPSRGTKYRRDLGRKIKVAVDLFTLDEKNYLVTVDYYSAGLLGAGQTAQHRSRSCDQETKGSFCKARQSLSTCKRKWSTIRCGRISEFQKGLGHQTHTNISLQ